MSGPWDSPDRPELQVSGRALPSAALPGPAVPGPPRRGAEPPVVREPAVPAGDLAVDVPAQGTSDPTLPKTADVPVDEALEALTGVLDRPLAEQLDVYAGVHRQLQDRLADLDE